MVGRLTGDTMNELEAVQAIAEDIRTAMAAAEARWSPHGMAAFGGPGPINERVSLDTFSGGFLVTGPVGPAMSDPTVRDAWLKFAGSPAYRPYLDDTASVVKDVIGREVPNWRKLRVGPIKAALKRFPADGNGPLADAVKGELARQGIEGAKADAIAAAAVKAAIGCCRELKVDVRMDTSANGWPDRRRKGREVAMSVTSWMGVTFDDVRLADFVSFHRKLPDPAAVPPRVLARLHAEAVDGAMAAIGLSMPEPAAVRRAGDFPQAETDTAIRSDPALATMLGVDPAAMDRFRPGYDWSKLIAKVEDREAFWCRLDGAVAAWGAATPLPKG